MSNSTKMYKIYISITKLFPSILVLKTSVQSNNNTNNNNNYNNTFNILKS